MLDPKKQSELDQAAALVAEQLPPLWRGLYNNSLREGFSSTEAFKLTQTYILAQCPYGIRGDDG